MCARNGGQVRWDRRLQALQGEGAVTVTHPIQTAGTGAGLPFVDGGVNGHEACFAGWERKTRLSHSHLLPKPLERIPHVLYILEGV